MRCHSFTGQGAISQKPNDVSNKTLSLALEHAENCQPGVSFVALGLSDFGSKVHKV